MSSDAAAEPIHLTPEEWVTIGRQLRAEVGRAELGRYATAAGARDPLAILRRWAASGPAPTPPRDVESMNVSPLAFVRGAGALMAVDLAASPVTGLTVQAVGDAHLANFAVVRTPQRGLVVDVIDYGDALRAPWEWDIKRLVVSVALAAAAHGSDAGSAAAAARRTARAYRRSLRKLARLRTLDLWRARTDGSEWAHAAAKGRPAGVDACPAFLHDAISGGSSGLVQIVEDQPCFASVPPALTPVRDLTDLDVARAMHDLVTRCLASYRTHLPPEHRQLLDRFRLVDVAAMAEVCGPSIAVLFAGRDAEDTLVLCLGEARASVLEPLVGSGTHTAHGERIVGALRLLEGNEDPFIGASSPLDDGRQYYWRQLPATVTSGESAPQDARALDRCAVACASCLAHVHARTGDPIAIAAYLGSGTAFDKAMAAFATAYAGQVTRDWEAFRTALADG